MSRKRPNPFSFLFSKDSDTDSASEGEMKSSTQRKKMKNKSETAYQRRDSDVEILKVEAGRTERHVEIVKVERGTRSPPDVEIVKVVPGSAAGSSNSGILHWPIECRKINVEGSVGKIKDAGITFNMY